MVGGDQAIGGASGNSPLHGQYSMGPTGKAQQAEQASGAQGKRLDLLVNLHKHAFESGALKGIRAYMRGNHERAGDYLYSSLEDVHDDSGETEEEGSTEGSFKAPTDQEQEKGPKGTSSDRPGGISDNMQGQGGVKGGGKKTPQAPTLTPEQEEKIIKEQEEILLLAEIAHTILDTENNISHLRQQIRECKDRNRLEELMKLLEQQIHSLKGKSKELEIKKKKANDKVISTVLYNINEDAKLLNKLDAEAARIRDAFDYLMNKNEHHKIDIEQVEKEMDAIRQRHLEA